MNLEELIIIVTFFLGVGLGIVAIVALFMNLGKGQGRLRIPGIEISGKGAPTVFLLVGAVLVMSGFGWASTREEVVKVVRDKEEVVQEARQLNASLDRQVELNKVLTARVSAQAMQQLKMAQPELMGGTVYQPSAKLKRDFERLPRQE